MIKPNVLSSSNLQVDLLYEELRMCMSLMGARRIEDITGDMVITKNLTDHVEPPPANHLPLQNYQPMQPLGLSASPNYVQSKM